MKEILELTSLNEVERFINKNKLSFLYISRPECAVCHAILPKLRELLAHYPHIQLGLINANQVKAVAARFLTFSVPALLLFMDQKEYIRADRFVRFEQLNEQIEQVYCFVSFNE